MRRNIGTRYVRSSFFVPHSNLLQYIAAPVTGSRCVCWILEYWPRCESPFLCVELLSMELEMGVSECWPSFAKQSMFTQSFVRLLHIPIPSQWLCDLTTVSTFFLYIPALPSDESRNTHLPSRHHSLTRKLRSSPDLHLLLPQTRLVGSTSSLKTPLHFLCPFSRSTSLAENYHTVQTSSFRSRPNGVNTHSLGVSIYNLLLPIQTG